MPLGDFFFSMFLLLSLFRLLLKGKWRRKTAHRENEDARMGERRVGWDCIGARGKGDGFERGLVTRQGWDGIW